MTTPSETTDSCPPARSALTRSLTGAAPWLFVALWSAGYAPVKVALPYCGPLYLLVLRYAGVVALLAPVWFFMRPPLPKTRRAWLHLCVVGFLLQGVYFALANTAIGLGASAAGLAIVLALQPIIVAVLEPRLIGGIVSPRAWLGLLLGLAGAIVVVYAKSGSGGATTSGILTAMLALVFISGGTLWEKRFGEPQHPVVASTVQCGVAGVIAFAAALPLETFHVTWNWPFTVSLAYLVIANSIVSMSLLFFLIQQGQATSASALFFLVPPFSSAIAWVLLGEAFPPLALAGMVLAGAGVWIARGR